MKKIKRKTINTESSEDVTHTNILKKEKGITLIALVVTIVVLLILAGVSINLVIGNNGIITKSKEARIVTRADNAEDEVELWKGNNYIAKNSNGSSESKNDMLQRLIDKKLVYEDEIDRNNEIITIKREDGTIVKEINYGGVVIHISKTPETEEAGTVVLQVASVEGIETRTINSDEDFQKLFEDIEALDEETKKTSIKKLYPKFLNETEGTNFSTFTEVLQYLHEQGEIEANTEEAFWAVRNPEDYSYIIMDGLIELCYDSTTGTLQTYIATNPDGETSNAYFATENGTYTFTVNDLLTGKIYTKSVEVNNIDNNLNYYIGTVGYYGREIALKDKNTEEPTTFEGAYIIFNGETIDITSLIQTNTDTEDDIPDGTTYIFDLSIAYFLEDIGKINSYFDMEGEVVSVILIKDGAYYVGNIIIRNVPG